MANLFYDLNVPIEDNLEATVKKVERLIRFGYHVIALNKNHTIPNVKRKRGGKKVEEGNGRPNDVSTQITCERVASMLKEKPDNFKILSRITVNLESQEQVRVLQNDYVQSFDLIAIRPANEKLFQQACLSLEHADILSMDLDSKIPFRMKHNTLGAAVERGVYLEVSYASAIRSTSLRQNVLANGISLVKRSKGRGVIISSNAENFMEIRGPNDVSNLGVMFGLKEAKSKLAISKNCHDVILHAYSRKHTAKCVITMRKVGQPLSNIETVVKNEIENENETETEETDEEMEDQEPAVKIKKFL
eukprot:Seg900.8 transcript_id=Seg900.8/GoldUCD/mRNA.D3Y31 product="putative ribonuclease P protein subunit 3" protein_id=Seg900.8/GoldUCD/D3Y31